MRYRWDPVYPGQARPPTPDGSLRASDAERNEVADRLARHYADGRLDQAVFKTRADRAIGATTRGDLDGLFDDLPRLDDELPPVRVARRRRLVPFLLVVALVAVAAGSILPTVHLSWLLVVLAGLFLWERARRRRPHHRNSSELDR